MKTIPPIFPGTTLVIALSAGFRRRIACARAQRLRTALAGLLAVAGAGCAGSTLPPAGSNPDGGDGGPICDAGSDACTGAPPGLEWFTTCGNPVCFNGLPDGGPLPDAGLRDDAGLPCPPVGSTCTVSAQTCGAADPYVACGAVEVCSDRDPKMNDAGCPISSRAFKEDIAYVDLGELRRLHDEALGIRLATYSYKPGYDSPGRHLGFVIEDDPQSPAVQPGRNRVDLYGYVSMAVAAIQVQEIEIAELRAKLEQARTERSCAKLR